jgi:hypothetical protein
LEIVVKVRNQRKQNTQTVSPREEDINFETSTGKLWEVINTNYKATSKLYISTL